MADEKCNICKRDLTTEENCEDGGLIPPELCDRPDGKVCHVAAIARAAGIAEGAVRERERIADLVGRQHLLVLVRDAEASHWTALRYTEASLTKALADEIERSAGEKP